MLQEEGIVEAILGDEKARVKVIRGSCCANCASQLICHTFGGSDEMIVTAFNKIKAKAGDKILLELPRRTFLRATAIIYLIPLIALLGGAFIGQIISEIAAIIGAVSGLILSFIGIWYYNKYLKIDAYTPSISKVIE